MAFKIVVLAKQVPDTRNVSENAMKPDGTVNRAALPAVFNPEDLNALEMALEIKDRRGAEIAVISMGPPAAAEILRDALERGADSVVLLTDRIFAGADTLATSYVLSRAIRKLGRFDLVICGRQAIDGDTAQVGPQVAENLGIPQVTYVTSLDELDEKTLEVTRSIEGGFERIRTPLPALVTVTDAANRPRPPMIKRVMRFKKAMTMTELRTVFPESGVCDIEHGCDEYLDRTDTDFEAHAAKLERDGLLIPEWNAASIDAELERCGMPGSPTKVNKIQNVVLKGGEIRYVEPTREGLAGLVRELIEDHTFD